MPLCLIFASCHDGVTTWSTELKSPNGQWVADAQSRQWTGPGTAYDATTVYIRNASSSKHIQVVAFSHQYATMNLKMKWLTPTHLQIEYGPSGRAGDRVDLDFQIARVSGIDISVEQLSRE